MKPSIRAKFAKQLTDPRYKEAVRQPLYDSMYFTSGATVQLRFFTIPFGQQQGAFAAKTEADTNMALAGNLSKGQKFVCDGIELVFIPGSAAGAGAFTRQDPFKQAAAVAAPNFANDVWELASSGFLKFLVGGTGKPYLQDSPLLAFPSQSGLIIAPTAEQNLAAAAAQTLSSDYARVAGRPYVLDPEIPLEETNAFEVQLNWPAAFALPSGFNARIVCRLLGTLFRN